MSRSRRTSRFARLLLPSAVLLVCCPLFASDVPAEELVLASVHAVVAGLDGDEVLLEKRQEVSVPIASITKLMTAMVVLDAGQPLDEWLPIVQREETHGKNGYSKLRVGSAATRASLLRLTLMASENLAAYNLAHHHPGGLEGFVDAMNARASDLGMEGSRFDDPSGLSTGNLATATDLLKLVRAAYGYEEIREYSTTRQYTATFRKPKHAMAYGNTNPLTASSRWDVLLSKTGYLTEAGRCLVMVAEVEEQPIVMVLLNSFGTRTPLGDAGRVRRWLTTGSGGKVARSALEYERRVVAEQLADDRSTGR
jgi:D-alanyl-D-alanine endopeptidase (penicillin-binding protein 7)